jgi:sugar phosphate isomerase/epimerase
VACVRQACAAAQVEVSALGSPVGKSPLAQPETVELDNLRRIFAIAQALGVGRVRVFSFYPEGEPGAREIDAAAGRLARMAEMAQAVGITLLLENEKGIVGDTLARCAALLDAVASPHLRFAWDPANFVQVGELAQVSDGWAALGSRVGHVHIKDLDAATGMVLPAGEGDGQVVAMLEHLAAAGYRGYVALEPHLAVAGHSSGFSGPEGMRVAAAALRRCLAQAGVTETRPVWAGQQGKG